jgi:hypothetical protein
MWLDGKRANFYGVYMSGSSGYPTSAASTSTGQPDCARYVSETVLSSPIPAVIRDLRNGEQLDIEFDSPPNDRIIIAKTTGGQNAGSITGDSRLRTCMVNGYRYVAIVQFVNGGACKVQIRLKAG